MIAVRKSLESNNTTNQSIDIDFNQLVEHVKDFIPSDFFDDAVMAEVTHMGLLNGSDHIAFLIMIILNMTQTKLNSSQISVD